MNNKIELLSPAGDMDALVSAICGGADAVYFGIEDFNARKRAKNFTRESAREAIELCHAHGVKSYITLNTALYDKELESALEACLELWNMGADGFIVADIGLASLIKEYYPQIEIHASTQCTVHNLDGANFLRDKLGFSRVVLARELDKKNIEYISKSTEAETEMFVHGAHCMSVSGQCLLSYAMGGRSGNRGECAQPCRLPYQIGKYQGYPLSLKDMTLASHINEIKSLGVASLKVEGRMKGKEYVGGTISLWRNLLNENRNASKAEIQTLGALFSRQGFTDGYFEAKIDKSMLGIRTEENKAQTSRAQEVEYQLQKPQIKLEARLFAGQRAELRATLGERSVVALGDVVEEARTAPMSRQDLETSLSKLGTSPFSLKEITIEASPNIMIRKSSLNSLRRRAIELLLNSNCQIEKKEYIQKRVSTGTSLLKTALFSNPEQIPSNKDYFDIVFLYLDRFAKGYGANGICMPPVIFDSSWDEIEEMLASAKKQGAEYALVTNLGQLERVKKHGYTAILDYRFNIFNGATLDFWKKQGVECMILSPELTLAQARDLCGASLITYGKIPVMTTHKCVIKDTEGCNKCRGYIKDRQGAKMFVEGIYNHLNIIYNSVPVYMADKMDSLKGHSYHFIFTDESQDQCYEIIEAYKAKKAPQGGFRRIK